jgi:phosphoribosylanthranilate isomerase
MAMNSVLVQIYEVQVPSEAEKLVDLGVDHIGSVILSEEAWKIPVIKETLHITDQTVSRSSLIPLFSHPDSVFRVLDYYQPDIIHFCETLKPGQINVNGPFEHLVRLQQCVKEKFPEIKIMRSIPISPANSDNQDAVIEMVRAFEPVSDYFLTDTILMKGAGSFLNQQPVQGFIGITGQTCNWNLAAKLVESTLVPVILAGGIAHDNVFDGIMQVRPAGVDSCTQTNAVDRNGRVIRFKKDLGKVERLVKAVRRAENELARIYKLKSEKTINNQLE